MGKKINPYFLYSYGKKTHSERGYHLILLMKAVLVLIKW